MNRFPDRFAAILTLAWFALAGPSGVLAQEPPATKSAANQASTGAAADYSKEPYIIQSREAKVAYQNDGTASIEETVRVQVQSNAGVQAYGILHFPYATGTSTMTVDYVRVTEPGGSVVETPTSDIQEVTPDISRDAPTYSDLKDRQLVVKGLQAGDTLEYAYHAATVHPLIPGQFWSSENLSLGAVVLSEQMQISVPRERYLQVKSANVQPSVSDQGDRRVYVWKTSQLKPTADQNQQKQDQENADSADNVPDIQLTTFHSWDEVGQWFKSLVDPQVAVTPAIKAKADEITASAKSDAEKTRLLYDFVSLKFRYVGISLGIGRYQPHAAADVLNNNFGDCKDKHTLFAALLAAENIKAVPVLINSSRKIDPDVPSPGQFDHVITALPQGTSYQFLDTTPEVAPYGLLLANLRDKQALPVPVQGPASLTRTPSDLPFPFFDSYAAAATLDASGTLVSVNQMILRGDAEVLFRALFRQYGPSKWNDVMQEVVNNLGFAGTVTQVSVASPEATGSPLRITYKYDRKDFSDFKDGQITPPIPPFFLPDAPENVKNAKPIQIGAPNDIVYDASIKLPPGSAPSLPASVVLHESFADYRAEYSIVDGGIYARRRLTTKVTEVPVDKIEAYRAFLKAMVDDEDAFIALKGGEGGSNVPAFFQKDYDISQQARDLFAKVEDAYKRKDIPGAMDAAQQAVKAAPGYWRAWLQLGGVQIQSGNVIDGLVSIKKAIAIDTNYPVPYDQLAEQLVRTRHPEMALVIWRAVEAANPDDEDAPVRIAGQLIRQMQYADAVEELDRFSNTKLADEEVFETLGLAYLHLATDEAKQKAAGLLVRAGDMAVTSGRLNNDAWNLADNGLRLDDAQRIAQNAVRQAENATILTSLNDLTLGQAQTPGFVASFWDTLGWAEFKLGHLDIAEKYLVPAWTLSQSPTIGAHLGMLYDKEGKKHDAALAFAGALSAKTPAPTGTRELLDAAQLDQQDKVKPDPALLDKMRTVEVPWQPADPDTNGRADFFVLLAPSAGGAKVVDVKFVSGSEQLRDASKALAATHFDFAFPDDGPVQIVRRGRLSCGASASGVKCVFVMSPPNEVTSVN